MEVISGVALVGYLVHDAAKRGVLTLDGGSPLPAFALMLAIHLGAFLWPRLVYGRVSLNFSTYLSITRLKTQVNNVVIVIGYVLASVRAGDDASPGAVANVLLPVLISFATFFYGGAIYVINALSDIEDDKKEKPHRPLPSKKMSVQHATVFALINLALSFTSAYLLAGMQLVQIYVAFLLINLFYSFVLRPWLSITIPLVFISVTLPLRLYMGATISGKGLPWPYFVLTYQIYIGMQFTRKVILQKNIEVRWAAP